MIVIGKLKRPHELLLLFLRLLCQQPAITSLTVAKNILACYKCTYHYGASGPLNRDTGSTIQSRLLSSYGLWLVERGVRDLVLYNIEFCRDTFDYYAIVPIVTECNSECIKMKLDGSLNGTRVSLVARGCRGELEDRIERLSDDASEFAAMNGSFLNAVRKHGSCANFSLASAHLDIHFMGTVCLCDGKLCNGSGTGHRYQKSINRYFWTDVRLVSIVCITISKLMLVPGQ